MEKSHFNSSALKQENAKLDALTDGDEISNQRHRVASLTTELRRTKTSLQQANAARTALSAKLQKYVECFSKHFSLPDSHFVLNNALESSPLKQIYKHF